MPLYEYHCNACNFDFEDLRNSTEDAEIPCKKCGSPAQRLMSRFASVMAGGSPTETVDMAIGREANKRWQMMADKQAKRRGDKPLQTVELPKTKDGKYMPVMGLGNSKERSTRNEFSSALQDHRKKRIERGQPQFQGTGAF